jgi:UDP-3-O-[3-hydroxymyristoyl] glucosamine N-acyltransferase
VSGRLPAPQTLASLAKQFDLEFRGDPDLPITGVCTLSPGRQGAIGFLANPRYRPQLAGTLASAVILRAEMLSEYQGAALIATDPYLSFARISALFEQVQVQAKGTDDSAIVDATAVLDASASIGPHAVVGARVRIAADVSIGPGCVIEDDVVIGAGSQLMARVIIGRGCQLGTRCRIGPGVVIGSRGFGLARGPQGWEDVPQLGAVRLGDNVEVGANTTIDRGAIDDTVIENGVKLDNQIQIGHNVHIGRHTAIAACVGVAGSTRIGANCLIGGGAGIGGHLDIGDGVVIQGWTMVTRSLEGPGQYGSGWPVEPVREWRRQVARLRRLDRLEERVSRLESGHDSNHEQEGD